jgi:phytoene dehydrogenase-like protein
VPSPYTSAQRESAATDVVVVGSGPNGLAAAIVAAQRGLSTVVFEANAVIGGGLRSAELTTPGFVHDVCASVLPMAVASPFFRSLPLDRYGLEWITPSAAAAHPLDSGDAAVLWTDADRTADGLGPDGEHYLRAIGAVARRWTELEADILAPIRFPKHPVSYARFGIPALLPANRYARLTFSTTRARALFAGCAAHSVVPFSYAGSAAIGIVIAAVGHARGWPVARGGSQSVANALAAHLRSLGGEILTGSPIETHEQLPKAGQVMFDTSPRAMARIMGSRLPSGYARKLEQHPYGPGAFKVDWALSAPIPWKARECFEASTVHVGGTLEEIAAAELAPWRGECAERPFVIVTQPSLFDGSRAPAGKHTAWGYCHVPNGSTVDMTARIEAQIERFAPGFRDVILARAVRTPATLEAENANCVGGDIGGGSNELLNLLFRPTWRAYGTPVPGVHLCSAATPPGGGVHGMCGYHAAVRALGPARS